MKSIKQILSVIIIFSSLVFSQDKKLNEYGLYVIGDMDEYIQLVKEDSTKLLVDLQEFIPGLKTDVRYATENNFLGEQVYPESKVFARLPAAKGLKDVQEKLKEKNLELKIYDSYRPYAITLKMYETYKDTTYVASAWSGSRHNRGCAVDLSIVSSETGEELQMPTPYDDFTEKAHSDFTDLPDDAIKNRELLRTLMEQNGYKIYPSEWWHFDFDGWKNFELVDLSFNELKEANEILSEKR